MRLRQRILIMFWLYVWAVIALFFTDEMLFFSLPLFGLIYVLTGGKRRD